MILVTGAAGKTGRAVIRALAQRNAVVRAYIHREVQSTAIQAIGATEVAVGDFQDATALRTAMQGIKALYHICPNMHPDEVAIGRTVIDSAVAADVEQLVYHSVLHPQVEAMPHHWNKLRVEELLLASRLPFTILQPTAYMQNLLLGWDKIRKQGLYTLPYPGRTKIALVDLEDVGVAAATVLTQPGHSGATYALVGTPSVSQFAVARILAAALGRSVQVDEITQAVWEHTARAAGMNDYAINTLLAMFTYYEQVGLVGNPNILGWLLGRPPTTLTEFVQRSIGRTLNNDDRPE